MNFVPQPSVFQATTSRVLKRRVSIDPLTFTVIVFLLEFLAVVALSLATGVVYHLAAYQSAGDLSAYLTVGTVVAAVFTVANTARGDYRVGNFLGTRNYSRSILVDWHVALLCLLALGFLAQMSAIFSRVWIALFYVSGLMLLVPLRRLLTEATRVASRNGIVAAKRIFIVGAESRIADFLQRYQPAQLGVEITGCCFLPLLPGHLSRDAAAALRRELDYALEQARKASPDAIFLLAPWTATEAVMQSAEKFRTLPAELHLAPDRMVQEFANAELLRLGPISTLQLTSAPLGPLQLLMKRTLDLVVATAAVIALAPLFIVVACMVKLDSAGPVFFLQRRYGYNQRTFRIVKFRTMTVMEDGGDVRQATRDDGRITRVGRWMRRWNIDELPQLFNVLRGDMSLVGPRPHALSHNQEYEKQIRLYARRHNVKPGITGWAQVHGYRGETDTIRMLKRVEYDLYYIEHWSLALDVQIMLRTLTSPHAFRNAY